MHRAHSQYYSQACGSAKGRYLALFDSTSNPVMDSKLQEQYLKLSCIGREAGPLITERLSYFRNRRSEGEHASAVAAAPASAGAHDCQLLDRCEAPTTGFSAIQEEGPRHPLPQSQWTLQARAACLLACLLGCAVQTSLTARGDQVLVCLYMMHAKCMLASGPLHAGSCACS